MHPIHPLRRKLFAVCLSALFLAATARAAKVDLAGASVDLGGNYKLQLEDGGSRLECGPTSSSLSVVFQAAGQWVGMFDGNPISGTWKQKGKGKRTVKIGLDEYSKSVVLNQAIDDAVSSCILSIPDGKPVKIVDLNIKGRINKKGTKLAVKVAVEFRSKEDGLFWDMRGDSSDVFSLKVKGQLIVPPPVAEAPSVVQLASSAIPFVPSGLKVTCRVSGDVSAPSSATCPVLQVGGLNYWALSYLDNRFAMAFVGLDASGQEAARIDLPGARYVYTITLDSNAELAVVWGQSNNAVAVAWSDL